MFLFICNRYFLVFHTIEGFLKDGVKQIPGPFLYIAKYITFTNCSTLELEQNTIVLQDKYYDKRIMKENLLKKKCFYA